MLRGSASLQGSASVRNASPSCLGLDQLQAGKALLVSMTNGMESAQALAGIFFKWDSCPAPGWGGGGKPPLCCFSKQIAAECTEAAREAFSSSQAAAAGKMWNAAQGFWLLHLLPQHSLPHHTSSISECTTWNVLTRWSSWNREHNIFITEDTEIWQLQGKTQKKRKVHFHRHAERKLPLPGITEREKPKAVFIFITMKVGNVCYPGWWSLIIKRKENPTNNYLHNLENIKFSLLRPRNSAKEKKSLKYLFSQAWKCNIFMTEESEM